MSDHGRNIYPSSTDLEWKKWPRRFSPNEAEITARAKALISRYIEYGPDDRA